MPGSPESSTTAFTVFGAMPEAVQQLDLFLSLDQRHGRRPCCIASNRLSIALSRTLIGMDRYGKAFHVDGAKVAVSEKIAEELPCLRPDHDRAGLGQSLQASGEVRRLAYDAAFLTSPEVIRSPTTT